jgi:hypothetical protein
MIAVKSFPPIGHGALFTLLWRTRGTSSLRGYLPSLPWLGGLKLLRDARYAICRS